MSFVGNFPTLDHTYENGKRNILSMSRAWQDAALAEQKKGYNRVSTATPHGRDWAGVGKVAGALVGTAAAIPGAALMFVWDTVGDGFRDYGRSRWSPLLHTAIAGVGGALAGAAIVGASVAYGGVATAGVGGAALTGALYGLYAYGATRAVVKATQAWSSLATICAANGARAGANIGDFISNVSDSAFAGWRRNAL
jgi:hypothetical protein